MRTVERPYVLTFDSGNTYTISSEQAQRLLDEYPIIAAKPDRVLLLGEDRTSVLLTPATMGGGPAFIE